MVQSSIRVSLCTRPFSLTLINGVLWDKGTIICHRFYIVDIHNKNIISPIFHYSATGSRFCSHYDNSLRVTSSNLPAVYCCITASVLSCFYLIESNVLLNYNLPPESPYINKLATKIGHIPC